MSTTAKPVCLPRFELKLREKKSPDMKSLTNPYEILLNDQVHGELLYKTRGYIGKLPTVDGRFRTIGQDYIWEYHKQAHYINFEARRAIERAAADPMRITKTWSTTDSSILLARCESAIDDKVEFYHVKRKAHEIARSLFGDDVGRNFFGFVGLVPPHLGPVAIVAKGDAFPIEAFAKIPMKQLGEKEAQEHERAMERELVPADERVLRAIQRSAEADRQTDLGPDLNAEPEEEREYDFSCEPG